MKQIIKLLTFSLFSLYSCSSNSQEIVLSTKNPTVYIFDFPIDVVKTAIIKGLDHYEFCSTIKRYEELKQSGESDSYDHLSVETSNNMVFSKDYISKTELDSGIYLGATMTLAPSTVYFSEDCETPLNFKAKYFLKLQRISNNKTKVSVKTLEFIVISGRQLIPELGMCGFWRPPIECNLPITTVEEFELLWRLGSILNVKDMPRLKTPEKICLTRKGKLKK